MIRFFLNLIKTFKLINILLVWDLTKKKCIMLEPYYVVGGEYAITSYLKDYFFVL